MSFFGFDTAMPGSGTNNNNAKESQPLDFDETYKGFGEHEREAGDAFNDETFGAGAELGNDFDFGHGATPEQSQPVPQPVQHRSYVAAANSGVHSHSNLDPSVDLKPMESLWMGDSSTGPQQPSIMSMEEIERTQRQMQMNPQHQPQQGFIQPPKGYGMPPQGFMQPPGMNAQYPNPNQYTGQFMQPGMPQMASMPQMHNQQQFSQAPAMYQHPPQQQPQFQPIYQNGQQPQHVMNMGMLPQGQMSQGTNQVLPIERDQQQLHQQQVPQQQLQAPQQIQKIHSESPQPQQNMISAMVERESLTSPNSGNQLPSMSPQPMRAHNGSRQQRREPLSLEEQKRLQIRHAKVEKILKHSGLMTPRDKDFITRYQLSQIVTEDPYNEDFYFQVYKIIQRGGVVGESNKGLIARAYLEHSGHRLGGRYKRADIALQRMQSQVEKAVTVAKERPQKNKDESSGSNTGTNGREGVLGKISTSMNSKAPRRQLQIPSSSKHIDDGSDSEFSKSSSPGALEEVTESLGNVDISQKSRVRRRSSYAFTSIDQNSVLSRSGGRKFVLSLIETVYEEVLELEANLRSGKDINNKKLWDALHVDDDIYEVCPFISMLSFDKGVKIMPRIFNFLDKSQKLKLFQTFFSELSHLNTVIISSYKTNPTPSEAQLKNIDLFQTVFLKIIVSFLSNSSNFIEIMGLLLHLIKNNNVSFISTSKIGLNLITVLISRAALIRQDTNRSNVLSSPEISTWNEIYDKLFTALESKLSSVFPPKDYIDRIVSVNAKNNPAGSSIILNYYDQAYIWQFLASLALSGKLNHQRIIIDEIREEIFGTINAAEELKNQKNEEGVQPEDVMYRREKLYQDLNLFLNVMGLVSRDGEITELK